MTVSDQEFAAWIAGDSEKTVLAELEFAYESSGDVALGKVYLASRPYTSLPTDSPPNQRYRACIAAASFKRSIDLASQGGKATFAVSELQLDNADGAVSFVQDLVIDGHPVNFYIGSREWARSDFRKVLSTFMEAALAPTDTTISVRMRDARLLLDAQVQGDLVGGSGPNSAKILPLAWGDIENLEPMVYDTAALTYATVSNYSGSVHRVKEVRDNGVSLRDVSAVAQVDGFGSMTVDAGTDTFTTAAAHTLVVDDVVWWQDARPILNNDFANYWAPFPGMSARAYWVNSVPSGTTFTISETKGGSTLDITGTTASFPGGATTIPMWRQRWFDDVSSTGLIYLSSAPAGRVTIDIQCGRVQDIFGLAQTLMLAYGGVTSSQIDATAFSDAATALAAKCAIGYVRVLVQERVNLIQLLDSLIPASLGWYGADNVGVITCGLLDLSHLSTELPTLTLSEGDVFPDGLSSENLVPGPSLAQVQVGLIAEVQTDGLAASVSDDARARWMRPYTSVVRSTAPSGTAYSTNKPLYHLTMVPAAPMPYAGMNSSSWGLDTAVVVGDAATEYVNDRLPHVRAIRGKAGLGTYSWPLGGLVRATYPRHGLDAGVNCRVTSLDVDLIGESVAFELATHVAPDTTTASYQ